MPEDRKPNRDDVLDAFAMESVHDRTTLERYLREFPEHAHDLVALSRELARAPQDGERTLTSDEEALVEAALRRHLPASATTASASMGSLSAASVQEQRDAAASLGVPRQVISAFREGKVVLATVPKAFLGKFAKTMQAEFDVFMGELEAEAQPLARAYKADQKPQDGQAVSFEEILIQAGVDEATRARLLADE